MKRITFAMLTLMFGLVLAGCEQAKETADTAKAEAEEMAEAAGDKAEDAMRAAEDAAEEAAAAVENTFTDKSAAEKAADKVSLNDSSYSLGSVILPIYNIFILEVLLNIFLPSTL